MKFLIEKRAVLLGALILGGCVTPSVRAESRQVRAIEPAKPAGVTKQNDTTELSDENMRLELRTAAAELRKENPVQWSKLVDRIAAIFKRNKKCRPVGEALMQSRNAKSKFALIGLVRLKGQLPQDICNEFGGLVSSANIAF